MSNHQEIISLLMKSSWRAKDIKQYLNLSGSSCGKAKAYEIRNEALQSGGIIRFKPHEVQVDSVLNLFGKNRTDEIRLIKLTEQGVTYEN